MCVYLSVQIFTCPSNFTTLQTLLISQYQRVSNFCYFLMLFPMCFLQRLANTKAHTSRFISANLPCNKFKNRLVNIMPYESTRVCLQPIRGVEGSDYINGSFIDGYRWAEEPGSVRLCVFVSVKVNTCPLSLYIRQQKAYIATQGPLAETTEDFWRMLWEHNSTIVVMLTKLREMGRVSAWQHLIYSFIYCWRKYTEKNWSRKNNHSHCIWIKWEML